MPSNKDIYARGQKALKDRVQWERKLATNQLQRFCQDRARVNNIPWPRASNVRYPLSDTLIDQKKPFFFKLLYSSEHIPFFKALVSRNIPHTEGCAAYLDFVTKERTEFEDEIQYASDAALQDGETIIKVTWDEEKQVPVYEQIDNLFIITPSNTTKLQDAPWVIHVRQFSSRDFVKEFSKYAKDGKDKEWRKTLENKAKALREETELENDTGQREDDEYQREGINRTTRGGRVVVWECHYEDDEGAKRMCSILPDDNAFDLGDDRAYPYDHGEWMFVHYKREKTNKKLHSARGMPELVQDGEHSLTAMQRSQQNAATLALTPVYSGTIPGTTQNFTLAPGSILPPGVSAVPSGNYPFEVWSALMRETREVWERRAMAIDSGIGKGNTMNDSRTKYEVQQISNQQMLGIELEAGNWKMFVRAIMKQAWALIVQFQPESLMYYIGEEMKDLPPDALNNDYMISISGSAEGVNKEWMFQKATGLWQASQNNPFANPFEAWKNLVQVLMPGQVQRFVVDPASRQQEAMEKAASDITLMMIGFPVQPKPQDNHIVAAMTAAQFLTAKAMKGEGLDAQAVSLIGSYIAAHREMLKQTDKAGYQQLTAQLAQLEQTNAMAPQGPGQMTNGVGGGETVTAPPRQTAPVAPPLNGSGNPPGGDMLTS